MTANSRSRFGGWGRGRGGEGPGNQPHCPSHLGEDPSSTTCSPKFSHWTWSKSSLKEKGLFEECPVYEAQLLSPINLWNLWSLFNRIRIIMGKFGCTQIRTSSSESSERKKEFGNLFFGFRYFAQRFNRPFDKNSKKWFFRVFLHT